MLNQDFRDILSAFADEGVEYLLVGAYALSAHGLVRATGDIDLWVQPTAENAQRVYRALMTFGAPADQIAATDFEVADQVIQLGVPPLRIDILTSISGVEFAEAWTSRELVDIADLQIPVISREHLIRNKEATGRPKDLIDLEWLQNNGPL